MSASRQWKKYFEVTVLLPFLDHLISDRETRFSKHVSKAAQIQGLLPKFLSPELSVAAIQDAVQFYSADLPNAEVIDEFARWKTKCVSIPVDERPSSLEECLKACGSASYPNLTALLKLFAVLPLSSVSCERSASALRRLHTYLRCTQTEQRLSALALVHVHYSKSISVQRVCKLFKEKHPRRLEVGSLLQ